MLDTRVLTDFWRAIPKEPPYLHPTDAAELARKGISLEKHGVLANLFPQPWVGPIRSARAFLLQLNPGFSGPEAEIEKSNRDFQRALRENLEGDLPNFFLDHQFSSHPGQRWVKSHLRGVAPTGRLATDVAQLEIFPYHSKSFVLPGSVKRAQLDLPSVKIMQMWARDTLIPAALRNQIAVVVQRSSKIWGFTPDHEANSIVVYRGAECQGGWITANTRGGQLLMRHLAVNAATGQ